LQELERATQLKVDPAMASHEDLVAAIARAYGAGAVLGHLPCLAIEPPIENPPALPANEDLAAGFEPDLLALATSMVKRASRKGTLSVHAEAMPGLPGALRFRVEGTLDP
jgi:hypothetical protein